MSALLKMGFVKIGIKYVSKCNIPDMMGDTKVYTTG